MLPPKENELITRIGAGTPMGNAMRRYWIPACLATEIAEPDCPPVRVRLLGEDLVAFRDSDGKVHQWSRTPALKVVKHDPLAVHHELLDHLTNDNVHDLVVYLETVK